MQHGETASPAMRSFSLVPDTKIVREVVELVNNPATSITRLAATVGKDDALTSMILRKANSSYYGFPGRVTSVNFALVLLGFNALRETLTQTLFSMAFRNLGSGDVSFGELWNHSLATGLLARAVAEKTHRCNPEEALIAGLLHDTGYLVSRQRSLQLASDVGSLAITPEQSPEKQEGNVPTHEEAGSDIARRWNLPPGVIEAIRYHHQPDRAILDPALTAAVHLADVLSGEIYPKLEIEKECLTLNCNVLHFLGLDEAVLSEAPLTVLVSHVLQELNTAPRLEEIVEQFRTSLVKEIEQMESPMKLVLALYYVEGCSWEEIAQVLHKKREEILAIHESAVRFLCRTIYESLDRKANNHADPRKD